jgi:hypothetical protein
LEQAGYIVFSWPEFEARAENLRMAALRGEVVHLGIETAGETGRLLDAVSLG